MFYFTIFLMARGTAYTHAYAIETSTTTPNNHFRYDARGNKFI